MLRSVLLALGIVAASVAPSSAASATAVTIHLGQGVVYDSGQCYGTAFPTTKTCSGNFTVHDGAGACRYGVYSTGSPPFTPRVWHVTVSPNGCIFHWSGSTDINLTARR